ncbi:MAG TPA: GNAT family N-acetyltransferase [Halanaerobiales bacterium]|nr:GNAT family N-acetyltransferase [Halanaerobiales bacterium]
MKKKIILETNNLYLREFTIDDTDQIYELSLEEGMKKWLPDQVYDSKEEASQILNFLISQYDSIIEPNKSPYVLGLELKENNELIGHIGLSPYQDVIEIGYAVGEKYQGFGYATEAVNTFSNWALKNIDIDNIWGIVAQNNKGSIKVLNKAGYTYHKKDKKLWYKYK